MDISFKTAIVCLFSLCCINIYGQMTDRNVELLMIKKTDGWGNRSEYRYVYDSIQNVLHVSLVSYGKLVYKQDYFFTSDSTFTFVLNHHRGGNYSVKLKNGLISEMKSEYGYANYVYDNHRLKKIIVHDTYNKTTRTSLMLTWDGNRLVRLISPATYMGGDDTIWEIVESDTCGVKSINLGLYNFVMENNMDEILFLALGWYGKLPIMDSHTTIKKKHIGPLQVATMKETYTDDGFLKEMVCKDYLDVRLDKYEFEWKTDNLHIFRPCFF